MIYVQIKAVKSEGRGTVTGNGWQDTGDITEAVVVELVKFHHMWDALGHGAAVTYTITVAPEASPRRTTNGWPLPAKEAADARRSGS